MQYRRTNHMALGIWIVSVCIALPVTNRAAAQQELLEAAELGEVLPPLVSTDWLEMNLGDPGLAILDARHGTNAYAEAHLPGAQHLTCENLRSSAEGTPGRIFPVELVETIVGRLGLQQYMKIVVYSDVSDQHAGFVATVLRSAGLQSVSILDGGLTRWTTEGRPVTKIRDRVEPTRVHLTPTTKTVVGLAEVRRALKEGSALLVDVRSREVFDRGHIPGAVHRFWKDDFAVPHPAGYETFRPADELEAEYRTLGVTPGHPTIVYCNTGHTAATTFWTLRYRIGFSETWLYDGSWLEWSSMPELAREPQGEGLEADIPPAALERARLAARTLATDLMGHLIRELKAGGPRQALGVCYEIAPSVAAEQSVEGVLVRRVSNRIRNTADTPDPYERVALRDLQWRHQQGTLPEEIAEVVRTEGTRVLRYLRPILVKKLCLQCHGVPQKIDPTIRDFLSERYPEDQAVGYEVGDLRGAVSVIVELED